MWKIGDTCAREIPARPASIPTKGERHFKIQRLKDVQKRFRYLIP
jgi:hypothetical protein